MKANKAKSSKKAVKKANKKVAKKELEDSISARFMEAITSLGQDASKIGKDVKKASKQIAKKLADKFENVKNTVEESFETGRTDRSKSIKRPLSTPVITSPKPATRAQRVVAKATLANTQIKPKRAYTRRTVNQVSGPATSIGKSSNTSSAGNVAGAKTNEDSNDRLPISGDDQNAKESQTTKTVDQSVDSGTNHSI